MPETKVDTNMVKQADELTHGFLVTAVPRSGTTFFARILNGHPQLLCGSERFAGGTFSPEHLTEDGFRTMDMDRKDAERSIELFESKKGQSNLILGEKFPRAYMNLQSIQHRFDTAGRELKLIVLVRDITNVANSWYRRAANANDASWDRGMYGVFPYLEQMFLARNLNLINTPENCLLVSYEKLIDPDHRSDILAALAQHLGISDISPMQEIMTSEAEKTAKSVGRDRSVDPRNFHTENRFFPEFSGLIEKTGSCLLTDCQDDLREMVDAIWNSPDFANEAMNHLRQETNPEVRRYQKEISGFYAWGLSELDWPHAKQLRAAMESELADEEEERAHETGTDISLSAPLESGPIRYFDVTDTVNFLTTHVTVTGIQRVQLEAISALATLDPDTTDRVAFLDATRGWISLPVQQFSALYAEPQTLSEQLAQFSASVPSRELTVFSQGDEIFFLGAPWDTTLLPASLRLLRLSGVRFVFYLHDILPVEVPEFFASEHCVGFGKWLDQCLTFADRIVCNSDETRTALFEMTSYEGPVTVADLNLLPHFLQDSNEVTDVGDDQILSEFGLGSDQYVLMVGTIEPRKNQNTALNVWANLRRRYGEACPKLVIVGKVGWLATGIVHQIREFRFPDTVVHLSQIDDQQLAALYRGALCTLSLSRREGWGLPVTESLATGTVCVVGRGSCSDAATQGLAIVVDELSERDITEKLETLLFDRSRLKTQRSKIQKKADFKSWETFTQELFAGSEDLIENQPFSIPSLDLNTQYCLGMDVPDGSASGTDCLVGIGWQNPEHWGCWSRAERAELAFRITQPGAFCLYGVVMPIDKFNSFSLNAKAENGAASSMSLMAHRRSLLKLEFEVSDPEEPVIVRFHTDAPYNFDADVTTPDVRSLGFAILNFHVVQRDDFESRTEVIERLCKTFIET